MGADLEMKLMLAIEPAFRLSQHSISRPLQLAGLHSHSSDRLVRAGENLEARPFIAGRGDLDRQIIPRRLAAEHVPGFREGPYVPVGSRSMADGKRQEDRHKTNEISSHSHFLSWVA